MSGLTSVPEISSTKYLVTINFIECILVEIPNFKDCRVFSCKLLCLYLARSFTAHSLYKYCDKNHQCNIS